MMSLLAATTLLLVAFPQNASSFAFLTSPHRLSSRLKAIMSDDSFEAEPFFEMHQIPTATTGAKLDRIVNCAENDGCDVQEMMNMIDGT